MRNPGADSAKLLQLLKEDEFDGQKGDPHSFRKNGQLRQPLVIVSADASFWVKLRCAASRPISIAWGRLPVSNTMKFSALFLAAAGLCAEPTHRLFVSNEAGDSLTVIDSRTGKVEKTVAVGDRPRGIGLSPDRSRVYVALGNENAIAVVDTARSMSSKKSRRVRSRGIRRSRRRHDLSLERRRRLGHRARPRFRQNSGRDRSRHRAEGVRVSPDGKQVLVTSESTNMVHVISAADKKVTANVLVGARPREVAFSPDGKYFWVTSEVAGEVAKVDRATNKIAAVNKRLRREINRRVKPKGILLSPDGKRLYVSLGRGNAIAVLNPDTLAIEAVVPAGSRVWGLALSRDGTRLYAANGLDSNLSVIDTLALKEIGKLPTGEMPWGVALDD